MKKHSILLMAMSMFFQRSAQDIPEWQNPVVTGVNKEKGRATFSASINGIVFADRTPQPALHEVKKAHEWINFKMLRVRENTARLLVENLYDFTNLDEFTLSAIVKADGKRLKKVDILFNGDGSIHFANGLEASAMEKSDIPRIGMSLCLPPEFDQLTWLGRGPWENYNDRNVAAYVDLYLGKASDQMVPYVRPQENGAKTGVRWAALTNGDGTGWLAVSDNPGKGFEMTAMPYLTTDFDATPGLVYGSIEKEQKHATDVKPRNLVRWNIDLGQRGLGSVDSWGSLPLEKYRYPSGRNYEYAFTLIPVEGMTTDKLVQTSKNY